MGNEHIHLVTSVIVFLSMMVLVGFAYSKLYTFTRRKVSLTESKVDDFMLELFKIPLLWLFYWLCIKAFSRLYLSETAFYNVLGHINTILLIFSVAWILVQFVRAGAHYIQNRLNTGSPDNLNARKSLTQMKLFKGIINSMIVTMAFAVSLMTIEEARTLGMSLLTSAGVIGIIVGFAAQKSIGMVLSGIQLAITQPIRLDDVVVVEGEWGRVEEITVTYVVVRIWDERCLVLPVSWFLEKPFQNWTRTKSEIIGSVFLHLDYAMPVCAIRTKLTELLANNPRWDGRVMSVQVTETKEDCQVVRILVSSSDSSKNWDLRAEVREAMISFVRDQYPGCFARSRVEVMRKGIVEAGTEIS